MPLPAHLDQTVDQVARDFIDPPLLVAPTLLTNPGNPGGGMMVVEVAESPDTPHMVGGIYYGRSETGKVGALVRGVRPAAKIRDHVVAGAVGPG